MTGSQVAAGHLITTLHQHISQTAHAGAANAYEMNVLKLFVSISTPPLSLDQR
jgi:hypothetical protein